VPGAIVRFAVLVVFAVGLVVFLVVRDEVSHRKPVVRRDEVDTRLRAAAVAVQIRAAGQARGKCPEGSFAAPVVAYCIAVLAVPLTPGRRKLSELITAFADVPRFRNELHPAQYGL